MKRQIKQVLHRLPYLSKLHAQVMEQGAYPAGHYYSPIPARGEVARTLDGGRATSEVKGVDFRRDAQRALLEEFARYYGELPFPEKPREGCRFYFDQNWFAYTDAIILYGFLRHFDPRKIVEIGSGFSSAVMLDTLERFPNRNAAVTFIEPYPARLNALIDPRATARTTLLEKPVQAVDLGVFRALEAGDLLFVDSSHVVKFDSDLHHILFDILPLLPVGTHVHFHDIFYPFEYPDAWLREGRYWNECYLLRAFLTGNQGWEIVFFNHYANLEFADFIEKNLPLCRKNFGGSLYLRKTG